MGGLLSVVRPKVSDALPDLQRINHKPIAESGSDSSLYESCIDTDEELERTKSSVTNGRTSQAVVSGQRLKMRKPFKHYYHKAVIDKNLTNLYCPEPPTLDDPSLMEDDLSASSKNDDDEDAALGTGKLTQKRNKNTKLTKLKKRASGTDVQEQEDKRKDEITFLTADSISSNVFSSVINDPAGGDSRSSMGAAFTTAWEIDFNDGTDKQEPPRKLKKKLFCKSGKKHNLIPKHVPSLASMTNEIMAERKVLDLRRWHCISRPQYKKSCGLSSVVSVWNYLFSTLGTGVLPPITQEEALYRLGFKPPFGEIRFGPFTGNATLMRWFRRLNDHYGVRGRAYYLYKPKGRLQTRLMTDERALQHLKNGLVDEEMAFIYHCLNHYFCPIGYEDTPNDATEAYFSREALVANHEESLGSDALPTSRPFDTWIIIGEPSRRHCPLHCKRWSDILQDLHMESPKYFNIRHVEKGIQERKSKKKGGNLHCLLAFKKIPKATGK